MCWINCLQISEGIIEEWTRKADFMKIKIIYVLLPLFLLGCSKKTPGTSQQHEQQSTTQPSLNLPFKITVVETSEAKEQNSISNSVVISLTAKDYDEIDELAAKFRASKERYADGTWKLACVYVGTEISDNASDAAWEVHQKQLQNWINARPQSITAKVAMALFLKNYAWRARGSGYANTVTKEEWQLFGQRLQLALDTLNSAKDMREGCPVYWSTLMVIAQGSQASKEQFNDIFNKAIKIEPDYVGYYQKRAVYLLPRWNGDAGEWENDLTQSADHIGSDDGDMLYAQVVWYVHHYGSENVFDENKGISWERMQKGFEVIEKRFPDSLAAKNEYAHLAVLAGDKKTARKYFDEIDGQVDLSVWDSEDTFTKFANWAYE